MGVAAIFSSLPLLFPLPSGFKQTSNIYQMFRLDLSMDTVSENAMHNAHVVATYLQFLLELNIGQNNSNNNNNNNKVRSSAQPETEARRGRAETSKVCLHVNKEASRCMETVWSQGGRVWGAFYSVAT